jgi:hypothetical protein
VYTELCKGCLGERCIHVKKSELRSKQSEAKCLFGHIHGLEKTCPIKNSPPPQDFQCADPSILDDVIWHLNNDRGANNIQPQTQEWPLLIPELSDITPTTSRISIYPEEGDWSIAKFKSIAWDMTGYLYDKVQGAQWVRDPYILKEEDWHYILGYEDNWIDSILFVDRLPDRLAINTPPTAILASYLPRLWKLHWPLLTDDDAPHPWLLTHGYPSYLDWPPAWHWNLGIRMVSSLVEYLESQISGFMGPGESAWLFDKSKKVKSNIRVPFLDTKDGLRYLWNPDLNPDAPTDAEWYTFPSIIPFIPGADTNQLQWLGKQVVKMGYRVVAIDAVNSIAHENFNGIPEAVSALQSVGVNHVMIYGPWPLHIPSKYVPVRNVSYIPHASHMDMTNSPPRFRRKKKTQQKWEKLPSYKITPLSHFYNIESIEVCACPACQAALSKEFDVRSIWRFGHLLNAGHNWMKRIKSPATNDEIETRYSYLWYQGPSYTVFRKCLHYPTKYHWDKIEGLNDNLSYSETKAIVTFPDSSSNPAHEIRWTWFELMHKWSEKFPILE